MPNDALPIRISTLPRILGWATWRARTSLPHARVWGEGEVWAPRVLRVVDGRVVLDVPGAAT